jgi:hypothetical protein
MTSTRPTLVQGVAAAVAACCAALVLVAVQAAVTPPGPDRSTGPTPPTAVDRSAGSSFDLSGSLAVTLRPGKAVPLDISVRNTTGRDLRVVDLTVRIAAVDAPRATTALPCSARDFRVRQASDDRHVDVDAGQRRTLSEAGWPGSVRPTVTMLDSAANQDGCKDAVLELAYAAKGTGR